MSARCYAAFLLVISKTVLLYFEEYLCPNSCLPMFGRSVQSRGCAILCSGIHCRGAILMSSSDLESDGDEVFYIALVSLR